MSRFSFSSFPSLKPVNHKLIPLILSSYTGFPCSPPHHYRRRKFAHISEFLTLADRWTFVPYECVNWQHYEDATKFLASVIKTLQCKLFSRPLHWMGWADVVKTGSHVVASSGHLLLLLCVCESLADSYFRIVEERRGWVHLLVQWWLLFDDLFQTLNDIDFVMREI